MMSWSLGEGVKDFVTTKGLRNKKCDNGGMKPKISKIAFMDDPLP